MKMTQLRRATLSVICLLTTTALFAEPVTYEIDPRHTFPSFEADHQGGLSVWRGKIRSTSGTIVIDREAQTGNVDVTMDMSTIDFGMDAMTDHAKAEDILDVAQFPTATYTGEMSQFTAQGGPTAIEGQLTLHGVTNPLNLRVNSFQCNPPAMGRSVCGADASGSFNRDDYGVDFGMGRFLMYVNLEIQVEGVLVED